MANALQAYLQGLAGGSLGRDIGFGAQLAQAKQRAELARRQQEALESHREKSMGLQERQIGTQEQNSEVLRRAREEGIESSRYGRSPEFRQAQIDQLTMKQLDPTARSAVIGSPMPFHEAAAMAQQEMDKRIQAAGAAKDQSRFGRQSALQRQRDAAALERARVMAASQAQRQAMGRPSEEDMQLKQLRMAARATAGRIQSNLGDVVDGNLMDKGQEAVSAALQAASLPDGPQRKGLEDLSRRLIDSLEPEQRERAAQQLRRLVQDPRIHQIIRTGE